MKSLTLVTIALLAAASSQPLYAQLYAADIDSDNVYLISPQTTSTALIGNSGEDFSFSGLALDTGTDTLYASDISGPGGFGLATIDRATGESTLIGAYDTGPVYICALTYDANNQVLYGVDSFTNGSTLYTIDPATGAATAVGPLGVNLDPSNVRCGLAWDPVDGSDKSRGSRG